MRVLLTGGLGFIGSHLVRKFVASDWCTNLINLDNMSFGSNLNNVKDVETNKKYTFVYGDIRDPELVSKLIKDVDVVVNVAAETHVDRSISNPRPFVETNIVGTFNLLEACRHNDVRLFMQISTDEIYGDAVDGKSFNENDAFRPSSPYSATKAAADCLVMAYNRTYGLNTIITRSTNNFGPYQHPEKLIPKTIIRAALGLKIPIYGTGKQVRDWIYVEDHVEAVELALLKAKGGKIYNISAGNEVSNLEIVKQILNIMDKPISLIEHVEDRPGHDIRYSLDSSLIRCELGWAPRHNLFEALKKTVKWYMENEWWWRPLTDERTLHPTPWKIKW
ncbi:MAG: dTDP-glucose 4,6-dehydratase [Nitrososphaerota archaeon]